MPIKLSRNSVTEVINPHQITPLNRFVRVSGQQARSGDTLVAEQINNKSPLYKYVRRRGVTTFIREFAVVLVSKE